VQKTFQAFPWEDANFHIRDLQITESMAESIIKVDHVTVCLIFSKLNWVQYIKEIENVSEELYGKFAMSFVKLLFFVQILEPSLLPDELPKIEKNLDLSLFHQVFNGSTFVELLIGIRNK
jgi:histidyl-tRNA synthetase